MSIRRTKTPPTREKRLSAVQAYYGDVPRLLSEFQQKAVKPRVRTFSQSATDDIINAFKVISGITDAAAVIHGPRGCGAGLLGLERDGTGETHWAVTDLGERDTIIGAERRLRDTIVELYNRHRPRLIFVMATPVVAINNDDVLSVVAELREELNTVIIPVFTDGFRSKTGSTGFDIVLHALVRNLPLDRRGAKDDFVNVLAVTEDDRDIGEIGRLAGLLGLEVNILPRRGGPDNIIKAPRGRISIAINADESDYLGNYLQEEYGVPFIRPGPPIGLQGTAAWLNTLGEALGQGKRAAGIIAAETAGLQPLLAGARLDNRRVYISLPPAPALALAALIGELGGELAGLTVEHIDELHQEGLAALTAASPNLNLHVACGQLFEEANILKRLQPDLYIGGPSQAAWAARLGIPAFTPASSAIMGFTGVRRVVGQLAKTLKNQAFIRRLAADHQSPYQANWYQKSVNWYIKQEVK